MTADAPQPQQAGQAIPNASNITRPDEAHRSQNYGSQVRPVVPLGKELEVAHRFAEPLSGSMSSNDTKATVRT